MENSELIERVNKIGSDHQAYALLGKLNLSYLPLNYYGFTGIE